MADPARMPRGFDMGGGSDGRSGLRLKIKSHRGDGSPVAPRRKVASMAHGAAAMPPPGHVEGRPLGAAGAATSGPGQGSPAGTATPFTQGSVFQHYRLGRQLGIGHFSTVCEGEHLRTGTKVAVKIINRSAAGDSRADRIVLNEIEILSQGPWRSNPNLMTVLEAFDEGAQLYLILPLCAGGELFDRIVKRGHFDERQASALMKTLVTALKALHDAGIIHRDLKPENILFEDESEDARPIITDFGLSHKQGSEDLQLSTVGSPAYVAPEVLRARDYGPPCDIWAMGVILYVLLVGFPPFYGDTDSEVFARVEAGRYEFQSPWWDSVSTCAKSLVRAMLTLNPKERITAADVLKHPWIIDPTRCNEGAFTDLSMLQQTSKRSKMRSTAVSCVVGARMRAQSSLTDVLGEAGRCLTAEEISALKASFFRVAPHGTVNRKEFVDIMLDLGLGGLPLHRAFDVLAAGGSVLQYKSFLMGLSMLKGREQHGKEALKLCFDICDADSSGAISFEELKMFLMASASDDIATELEKAKVLADVFARLDTKGDNQISFAEFEAGIRKEPLLVKAFLRPFEALTPRSERPSERKSLTRQSSNVTDIDAASLVGGAAGGAGNGAGGSALSVDTAVEPPRVRRMSSVVSGETEVSSAASMPPAKRPRAEDVR